MLPLVVSACGSTPPAPVPCVKPPAPPAWIMQPAPDWQTPLNGIISSSELSLIHIRRCRRKARTRPAVRP
ncbi:Rz1 family lipoprotein, partial [Escherichia coli]|uniref:Rz1 family lipoprotein n=1 Tax=Escherichia coli TaxID=562 RepID=UPI00207B781F